MSDKPKIIIPEAAKFFLIAIQCKCGQQIKWETRSEWKVNIIGFLQFRCPCGNVINAPTNIWESEVKQ